MDATLQTQIEELARETAGLFVEEFGEPLDPGTAQNAPPTNARRPRGVFVPGAFPDAAP